MNRNELNKLNKSQRKSLRDIFGGRRALSVTVDETINLVTINFGVVTHFVLLGPRGAIQYHQYMSNRSLS